VLSYGLWTRRYATDPAIVNQKILLNGRPYTVLGVMPPDFQYRNRDFALWTPLATSSNESRGVFDYACIARLKDGVTLAQAQDQMSRLHSKIVAAYPDARGQGMYIAPMIDQIVGNVRTPLYFLMGAVFCLLLIGCANLANLLVVRSTSRRQELVVRAALGASKRRLVLQSIMEFAPLAVIGGVGGVMLARWLLSLLVPYLPATMPRVEAVQMDWRVLTFAALLLFGTTILSGIWPVFHARRWNLTQAMRETGRTTHSRGAIRLRNGLVVGQITAVAMLLIVSTLLIRSFVALRNVDPGFRTDHILSVHFALSEKYGTNPQFGRYLKRILDGVNAIPGVVSSGIVNRLPLAGQTQTGSLFFDGTTLRQDANGTFGFLSLDWRTATPDYFRTLRIPLIAGRFFDESDTLDRPPVGIIDERLARLVWPNENALGKRFRFGDPRSPWTEVVGIVGHIRHDELGVDQRPQVYWSYHQRVQPRMALAVRTQQDPGLLTTSVLAAIHDVDPDQPVYDVRPMDAVVDRSLSKDWLNTALLSLFAAIALVLATVGVYGVLSYSVNLRAREIGIRMALGCRRSDAVRMVLRHGAVLAGAGTLIGVMGSLLLGRVVSTLLYAIKPTDGLSFVLGSSVLLIVALAASFIPARRAASVDPLSVLRAE